MENKITPEIIEKAKSVSSVEELLALAKENDIDLTEEEAKEYFGQLRGDGELSDEELENVAGGGCGTSKEGYPQTLTYCICDYFECKKCGSKGNKKHCGHPGYLGGGCEAQCMHCVYFKETAWHYYCKNPANRGKEKITQRMNNW